MILLVPTGNPPSLRFGHPDVTTEDTGPSARSCYFARGDGYAFRKRHQGAAPGALRSEARKSGASGAAGAPAGAEEVHSLPTHRALKPIDTKESPTRGDRAGDSLYYLALDGVQRLTLSLRNALLRHRVGGTKLLSEEADAQLLNHPVHAAERIRHDGACR